MLSAKIFFCNIIKIKIVSKSAHDVLYRFPPHNSRDNISTQQYGEKISNKFKARKRMFYNGRVVGMSCGRSHLIGMGVAG